METFFFQLPGTNDSEDRISLPDDEQGRLLHQASEAAGVLGRKELDSPLGLFFAGLRGRSRIAEARFHRFCTGREGLPKRVGMVCQALIDEVQSAT